jgi:hypothetical protein
MTASGDKLTAKLKDRELAEKLVEAGLKNPGLIRRATDRAVTAAVGRKSLAAVRAVFPRDE